MARYKVLSGFCISSGKDVYPGDFLTSSEVSEADAKRWMATGRITEVSDKEAHPGRPRVGAAVPAPEHGDPTAGRTT